jgi:hypothetical protein
MTSKAELFPHQFNYVHDTQRNRVSNGILWNNLWEK